MSSMAINVNVLSLSLVPVYFFLTALQCILITPKVHLYEIFPLFVVLYTINNKIPNLSLCVFVVLFPVNYKSPSFRKLDQHIRFLDKVINLIKQQQHSNYQSSNSTKQQYHVYLLWQYKQQKSVILIT